ncbi:LacI family DNA-binding transcriptional regulator [Compostimonas suwonensis]|uniref:DNA-binding LacI/PurR family transcriptional regulator n=1 Tax=Compostimonas suwonensis TaxID=1048394 RepID=A0A2M9BCV2_9MICO|nr:LacI family DNA-binding transcriptional regulator [Compostimonas suwonensis]PJJ55734.1 DNA-binding LacI/PurR family transcriptional regulator [Compostimonas suwonensis]
MSAIADVAKLAGVSKATASRALSGKGYVAEPTRLRVTEAAAQIGYVASPNAASLVTGQTKNVGVVIPFINRWFFAEVLEGIEEALLDRGYDMTLYNLSADSPDRGRIFEFFLARKRFDGVIAVGVEMSADETARLHSLGKPVVGVGGPLPGIHTIGIDDVATARLATEHLLRLGHTAIVHIGGRQAEQMDFAVHGKRLTGFLEAMHAAGLPADGVFETEMSLPGGYEAGLRVLGDPRRPTAVFAASDEVAIGAIIAARQLGILVPAELSVIGIDGHEYADMFRLTTLEQHPRSQGTLAVELLMAEVGASDQLPTEPSHTLIPVDLAMRVSTRAPGTSAS